MSGKRPTSVLLVIRLLGARRGGAERVFCELANVLAEAGYRVKCVYCQASDEPPAFRLSERVELGNLWDRKRRHGLRYRLLDVLARPYPRRRAFAAPAWLSRNSYFLSELVRLLRAERPDVVVSFLPPANTVALAAGALTGTKVVVTNHNVPEHDYRSPSRWDQNPLDRYLRFQSLRGASRIHVLSERFVSWFPRHLRARVIVIRNCLGREFEQVPPLGERPKRVIAVGRLVAEKGFEDLVEAWRRLRPEFPDWVLRIYGEGPLRAMLTAQIRAAQLEDCISLMGDVEAIRDAYLQSSVMCHPARHEGFGLAVAEGLSSGLPVVAYRECEGVSELVDDGHNGLLVPRAGGPAALAEAISRLIVDSPLHERLAGAAPSSVAGLKRREFAARWRTLIDDVCGADSGSEGLDSSAP